MGGRETGKGWERQRRRGKEKIEGGRETWRWWERRERRERADTEQKLKDPGRATEIHFNTLM